MIDTSKPNSWKRYERTNKNVNDTTKYSQCQNCHRRLSKIFKKTKKILFIKNRLKCAKIYLIVWKTNFRNFFRSNIFEKKQKKSTHVKLDRKTEKIWKTTRKIQREKSLRLSSWGGNINSRARPAFCIHNWMLESLAAELT